jgi:hypothetical protein
MTSKEFVQDVLGECSKKDYNPDIEGAETVEFQRASTFYHFLLPSNFRLINKKGVVNNIPQSDMTSRPDVLEKYFDDSVRGALNQSLFND